MLQMFSAENVHANICIIFLFRFLSYGEEQKDINNLRDSKIQGAVCSSSHYSDHVTSSAWNKVRVLL
jgi:hypothetical protein